MNIALDNMNGIFFCEKVNMYLSSQGKTVQKIIVMRSRIFQDKLLETARMVLFDMCIDFVNFRSEDNDESSSTPGMKFGTAEEDVSLRDFTINGLFYNINTRSVEDFMGKGIQDLKSGKIATPLHPKKTFLNDPLCVLLAIRFGTMLGFELDEELKRAASDDDLISALIFETSRERVGHEVDLMMTSTNGNQRLEALTYISDLQLFQAVFHLPYYPAIISPAFPDDYDRLCVAYMDDAWRLMQLVGLSTFNDEQRRLALYVALLLPFRNSVCLDISENDYPVIRYMFRDSLRLKFSDGERVMSLHSTSGKFLSLIPMFSPLEDAKPAKVDLIGELNTDDQQVPLNLRVALGVILQAVKDLWRVALLLSTLLYDTSVAANSLDVQLKIFHSIEDLIKVMGLEKIWDTKPLFNGEQIMKVLDLEIGGPLVGELKQKLLKWQLAYPSGTAEQCVMWLKKTY